MLATALESLGRQHRPPDEIVVVDNGSSDQSAEVARAAGARVVPQPVRGIPSAASTGYDAATGDIIARIDADTICPPAWLARIERRFAREPGLDLTDPPGQVEVRPVELRDRVVHDLLQVRAGRLSSDAIIVENAGDPTVWPEWAAGEIIAQDEAAQLVARLAAPLAGQTVIDAAAAPGGKTTHLAQLMDNDGKIIACDVGEGRLKLVCDNAKRLGISII